MSVRTIDNLAALYETEKTAWLEKSAERNRQRRHDKLDFSPLSEFVDNLFLDGIVLDGIACHDRREVGSWRLTIEMQRHEVQRQELEDLFESETLGDCAVDLLPQAYANAIYRSRIEAGFPAAAFSRHCPYSIDDLVRPDWFAE
jgi:hypothetical protein